MAFSNYMENEILDWINGGAFTTQPTATWVQLFNGNPTDTGTGGTALYTRASVAAGGWTTTTGSNGNDKQHGGVDDNIKCITFGGGGLRWRL
jgi:hypothetical protein